MTAVKVFMETELIGSEFGLVELLPGGDQAGDDTDEFAGGAVMALERTEFGGHAAIEITDGALTYCSVIVPPCVGSCNTAVHFASAAPQDFADADIVIGHKAHPEAKAGALRNFVKSGPISPNNVCAIPVRMHGIRAKVEVDSEGRLP